MLGYLTDVGFAIRIGHPILGFNLDFSINLLLKMLL
jgi:hypothetical protein